MLKIILSRGSDMLCRRLVNVLKKSYPHTYPHTYPQEKCSICRESLRLSYAQMVCVVVGIKKSLPSEHDRL